MKNIFPAAAFCCALTLHPFLLNGQTAEPLNPTSVITVMKQVADWQLANPGKEKPTDWTQGVYYTGLMALNKVSQDDKYLQSMLDMGGENDWKPGPRPYHADDFAVCQTYCELYEIKKDRKIIDPTIKAFDFIIANLPGHATKKGDPDFTLAKDFTKDRWNWADALFMAPAAWTRLAVLTGDNRYLDFMDQEWWVTTSVLYDPAENLFYRDTRYFDKKTASGAKVFWSRGNGWVYAGIARVLQYMPKDYPSRPQYVKLFQEMTTAVLKTQQPDGLWTPSLLDPVEIPRGEVSGSGLFTFGLAWGVNNGLIDAATAWPAAAKGWSAIVGKVDRQSGRLGSIQPVGDSPKSFTDNSTDVYGIGAFLLAGSEIYKKTSSAGAPAAHN